MIFLLRYMFLLSTYLIISTSNIFGQENFIITHNDSLALENIIIEKYYTANAADVSDTVGGLLSAGSIIYRIYVDMKPDYTLQLVYGNPKHELFIQTSSNFYNNMDCRAETGFNIDIKKINKGNSGFDSWITLGAAAHGYTGVMLEEDTDKFSFLDRRPCFAKQDGFTKSVLPDFKPFNLDLSCFNNPKASKFSTTNGGWAALRGIKGPTKENKVLIAQITTNGKLTYQFNIQIGTPTGGYVKFVANNPDKNEIELKTLSRN